jgi:CBS domain-containing protein
VYARDIMSTNVVAVAPNTPMPDIARTLFERRVSAVPVIDESGMPIGIVSEGDLLGRRSGEAVARRDWWLAALAEGEHINPDFITEVRSARITARELMSAPVVTVNELTDVKEIADLLSTYRIKRVPVVRDGHIVGIVSRADIIKSLAEPEQPEPIPVPPEGAIHSIEIVRPSPPKGRATPAVAAEDTLSAKLFRHLMEDFERARDLRREQERQEAEHQHHEQARFLLEHHVADSQWQTILNGAREAASRGEKEYMALRFPAEVCSDGGRAINAPEPTWPTTLRGEAAEVYLRWLAELQPKGFHLTARVLEFPRGIPGDIGLFLSWGG